MTDEETKLSTALWCDLETDRERAAWLLLGRGYETGVVCKSIQNQLAMAYSRLNEYQKAAAVEALEAIDEGWLFEDIDKKVAPALRQALAEPPPDQLPDTTKMIDNVCIRYWLQDTIESGHWATTDNMKRTTAEFLLSNVYGNAFYRGEIVEQSDMPIDRGAWSDVPNATKWVDELRGDEPSTDVEPIGEIVEAHGLIAVSIPEMPPVGTKLYAQPLLNQTCCGCGKSGGYALYCGWCWSKFNKS